MLEMWLRQLELRDFRNHEKLELMFDSYVTQILGDNGRGKTNILEAIYLLLTGKPRRAGKYAELVRWGSQVTRVSGILAESSATDCGDSPVLFTLQDILQDEVSYQSRLLSLNSSSGSGGHPAFYADLNMLEVQIFSEGRAKYSVNGVSRQRRVFARQMDVVWFGPEDLSLISGSAAKRREYMDEVLSGVDEQYDRFLGIYEQSLRRRNKLLIGIREGVMPRSVLNYWDEQILNTGIYIQEKRAAFLEFLQSFCPQGWNDILFQVSYDKSEISLARLAQYAREEVLSGTTLVGPHRDDVIVTYDRSQRVWHNLRLYGSRGQQRMGALWMKLAELEYVHNVTGVRPILLLDDVLSELDNQHQEYVRDIMGRQQTVVTGVGR